MKTLNTPTRAQALESFFQSWSFQPRTEQIPLAEACGRVLAETQYSRHALPVVRASGMDGIGVDSSRFLNGIPDTSQWILGVDYARADTGDDFDDRFDAVIPIENITFDSRNAPRISPETQVSAGSNVRGPGSMVKEGDLLMEKNLPLRPADLAVLATGGVTEVPVYKKPRVAFIPAGSELIPAGTPLSRGKNIDSNSIMAEHTLNEMGARPICYPIVKDDLPALKEALRRALAESDIVIVSGGSSKGDEDYGVRLIQAEGELIFQGIAAAPGRPMSAGIVGGKPVVNISGPTLAAFYGLDWFVRPIVAHCLSVPPLRRQKVTGVLTEDLSCPPAMEILCKVQVRRNEDGGYTVRPCSRNNATMSSMMASNALYISKIGGAGYKKGDTIEVELLRSEEYLMI
ncbi:MAG: molybdopterin molybdotransferase MoeA [Peptococcaceae bacterium]|jgi:molybdopterin molybdotransferase/putative molybdopterin biosynthesis protein|nr:molybdopterin molybdotransferase MoeA [Peptococcaceae bacterium]